MKKLALSFSTLLVFVTSVFSFPGLLDPFFGNGGVSKAQLGKNSYDQVFAAALQSDGKLIVAGDSSSDSGTFSGEPNNLLISRVNVDGTLDTSFGSNGVATKRLGNSTRANSVVVQPDGKIVVGGYTLVDMGSPTGFVSVFMLARFNSNGSADNSFGTGGVVITSFMDISGMRSQVMAVGLQADGKIVAGGTTFLSSANPVAMAVTRYNSDGSLDTGFDGDGRVLVDYATSRTRANALAIQSDGKILIGGYAGDSVATILDFAIARLNTNGSLDTGFDGDGKTTTSFTGTRSTIYGLALQSDGKIAAVGSSQNVSDRDIVLARYNTDGTLDTSFDFDGRVTTIIGDDFPSGIAIQSNGKLVVSGFSVANQTTPAAMLSVRYNTDGLLDNTYNATGYVTTSVPDRLARANALAIRPDGKIVLAGLSTNLAVSDVLIARYETNGSPDTTLDGDGLATVKTDNSADQAFDIALQRDGKILATGYSYGSGVHNTTIARYNLNGTLDTGFGSNGSIIVPAAIDNDQYGFEIASQTDNKVVVSVGLYFGGPYKTLRFNENGTPDNTFGTNGVSTVQVGSQSDLASAMAIQPDGKILSGGSSSGTVTGQSLLRLLSDGTPDPAFGANGSVITPAEGRSEVVRTFAFQADGKIVAAGTSQNNSSQVTSFFVTRYNANGTVDNSFGDMGTVITTMGNYAGPNSMVIQRDGKIVVLGPLGAGNSVIVRYNTNGSLDETFDGDGKLFFFPADGLIIQMAELLLQPNGKFVVAGSGLVPGSSNNPDRESVIMRLNSDGSYDTSFGTGGRTISSIGETRNGFFTLVRRPNGRLIAGGYSSNGANDDFTLAAYQSEQPARFDYDGDGKSDLSVFRPSEGNWYVQNSGALDVTGVHFGQSGDMTAPGDFDGDGKADISVFRPSEGNWYRLNSSDGSFTGLHFGTNGDKPAVGDFDGDGRDDISVFRPSEGNWYRLNSTDGSFFGMHFGLTDDKPAVGDFDGDGKSDISVFRPSEGNWYRFNSSDSQVVGLHFGVTEDLPAVADFDGDGKSDISVFRPSEGTWYRLNSSNGSFFGMHFGAAGDKPVAADYDGDGRADIGVFRPSEGNWYIMKSTTGFFAQHFGTTGDVPTPGSFVY